jgi:hypothetical protein
VPATLNTGSTLVADNPDHPVSRAIIALAESEAGVAKPVVKHKTFWGRKGRGE